MMPEKKKSFRGGFRKEMLILFYAIRHRGTPWWSRVTALLALAYLVSPIDIIPDVIPIAGWLDDLVIVPLLLHLSFRLLPARVIEESRARSLRTQRAGRQLLRVAFVLVLVAVAAGCWWWYRSRQGGV